MNNFINKIKSATKEEIIMVSVFLLVLIGIIIWIVSSSSSNSDEAQDLENPQVELSKYNNKLDAINKGKEEKATNEKFERQFETDTIEEKEDDNMLSNLDKQISQIGQGNQSDNQTVESQSNNHDVYGSYEMWQDNEPRNSGIGYSSANRKNKKSKKIEREETTAPTQMESKVETVVKDVVSTVKEAKPIVHQVSAQLISQGMIQDGRTLSFALNEAITLGEKKLPKNFVIQGKANLQGDRIMVSFYAIKYKKKLYPVHIELLDNNGMQGMGIIGAEEEESTGGTIAEEVINRTTSNIPIVGGAIPRVQRSKRAEKRKVEAQPAQVFLNIYE